MNSRIRYQGAIVRDHGLLLIQHREHATGRAYWIIPGGGREAGESEAECVAREMWEETGLKVRVEQLLLDQAVEVQPGRRDPHKTYLCSVVAGEARPGCEPEPEVAIHYHIDAVAWFDLRRPETWDPTVRTDHITYPLLLQLQQILGYPPDAAGPNYQSPVT